jgi:hypothetical protein
VLSQDEYSLRVLTELGLLPLLTSLLSSYAPSADEFSENNNRNVSIDNKSDSSDIEASHANDILLRSQHLIKETSLSKFVARDVRALHNVRVLLCEVCVNMCGYVCGDKTNEKTKNG